MRLVLAAPALASLAIATAELPPAGGATLATGRAGASGASGAFAESTSFAAGGALCVGATVVVGASWAPLESWHPPRTLKSRAEPNPKKPNRQRLTRLLYTATPSSRQKGEEMRLRGRTFGLV